MLEQKDLQAIAEIIDSRVGTTEERLNKTIGTLSGKIEVLEETTGTLSGKIGALEETTGTLSGKIDALEETTEMLSGKIDALEGKIIDVERGLVNELVRTEDIMNRRIEEVKNELEEINQYYRVAKLENGNTGLVLEMLEGVQKRIEELERKIA